MSASISFLTSIKQSGLCQDAWLEGSGPYAMGASIFWSGAGSCLYPRGSRASWAMLLNRPIKDHQNLSEPLLVCGLPIARLAPLALAPLRYRKSYKDRLLSRTGSVEEAGGRPSWRCPQYVQGLCFSRGSLRAMTMEGLAVFLLMARHRKYCRGHTKRLQLWL